MDKNHIMFRRLLLINPLVILLTTPISSPQSVSASIKVYFASKSCFIISPVFSLEPQTVFSAPNPMLPETVHSKPQTVFCLSDPVLPEILRSVQLDRTILQTEDIFIN
ncbi:hypothetical protein NPIL_363501 [Nephila pilipes]|uniref:Uncharacterized protein n=1 Tax=Nephila pilipes TaxID=299642 RepID=A0A8X6NJH1_NEPPI|nr:hypothetical protein NPIL_363501 [Nephila pilipes]